MVSIEKKQDQLKGTLSNEEYLIKNEKGEVVGNFVLLIKAPPGKEATAYLNTINTKLARGNGYGRAAYLKIIENLKQRNIHFKSSEWTLSRDAKKSMGLAS